jgi:uncharacterized protein (UPF0179 family)
MKPEKKYDCIDIEILSGGVAVITLNRPPANALAEVGKNATRGGKIKLRAVTAGALDCHFPTQL